MYSMAPSFNKQFRYMRKFIYSLKKIQSKVIKTFSNETLFGYFLIQSENDE